jgi:hypothetical protein
MTQSDSAEVPGFTRPEGEKDHQFFDIRQVTRPEGGGEPEMFFDFRCFSFQKNFFIFFAGLLSFPGRSL